MISRCLNLQSSSNSRILCLLEPAYRAPAMLHHVYRGPEVGQSVVLQTAVGVHWPPGHCSLGASERRSLKSRGQEHSHRIYGRVWWRGGCCVPVFTSPQPCRSTGTRARVGEGDVHVAAAHVPWYPPPLPRDAGPRPGTTGLSGGAAPSVSCRHTLRLWKECMECC